jgi:hypothetical protein
LPTHIPPDRRRQLEKDALAAWLMHDEDALYEAMHNLVNDGTPNDALLFVIDMVTIAYGRRTDHPGWLAAPMVGRYGPNGEVEVLDIDGVPLGVAAYARISAAHMNGDTAAVAAHFAVLLEQDTPEAFQQCMTTAISQAAQAARRIAGSQQ